MTSPAGDEVQLVADHVGSVAVSAVTGEGIDDLLRVLLLLGPRSGHRELVLQLAEPVGQRAAAGRRCRAGAAQRLAGGVPGGGIAVNAYLWRASLDTVSFMPLASADPFGGVIITDWYSTQKAPNERFKLVIYIVSRQLLASGVKVAVYKQTRANGTWTDAPVKPDTAVKIENAILTRAQQLRSGASS